MPLLLGAKALRVPLLAASGVATPPAGNVALYAPNGDTLIAKNSAGVHRTLGPTRVVTATTAAGTLATSFENGDSVGGVTVATGDWILIDSQATASENGVYVVNASGAPTRAPGWDTAAGVATSDLVAVASGTKGGRYYTTSFKATDTLGTTAMRWYRVIDDQQLNYGMATRSISSGQSFTAVNTEQLLQAWTIPANSLQVGSTIRLVAECYATQTAVSSNMTLRARIGAVGGGTGNALAAQSGWTQALARTNIPFTVVAHLTCRSTGSSGTIIGGINFYGEYITGATNASAAAVTAAVTVDTTADRDVQLSLHPSVTTITAVNIVTNTFEVVVA